MHTLTASSSSIRLDEGLDVAERPTHEAQPLLSAESRELHVSYTPEEFPDTSLDGRSKDNLDSEQHIIGEYCHVIY